MIITRLPYEICNEIASYIPLTDLKSCLLVNHRWYDQFKTSVFKHIHIRTRLQFRDFFSKIQEDKAISHYVRELRIDKGVGLSNQEFTQLPVYCPYIEYVDFNPYLWRYFSYAGTLDQWQYVHRYPSMSKLKMTLPILQLNGKSITYLEMTSGLVDELIESPHTILSLLEYTPHLTSLILHDGIIQSQHMSIHDLESMHHICPRLESLTLDSFNILSDYTLDFHTIHPTHRLKSLTIHILINNEHFLNYWAHKYPDLESLDVEMGLLEPTLFSDIILPENVSMKESWIKVASHWSHLKLLTGKFDERYFPFDLFARGIVNSVQLQELSIHFTNLDYHRRSANQLKQCMWNSRNTLRTVALHSWDPSWSFNVDILGPLGQLAYLESLSLAPQPGLLTEFYLDIILDQCTHLKKLHLANTYNLFVRDDIVSNAHLLEEFVLHFTMVNDRLFQHLSSRCPKLSKLHVIRITKPHDNSIFLNIDMPHHRFESVHVEGLRLGLRIEDSGFQSNCASTLCSIKTAKRERWYHKYQPKDSSRKTLAPRLQRLSDDQINIIKTTKITPKLWSQVAMAGNRYSYETKENWASDIPFGLTSIHCHSSNEFKFEGIIV